MKVNKFLQKCFKKTFQKLFILFYGKIVEYKNHFIRKIDPIFNKHKNNNILDFRTQLYVAKKPFLGTYFNTFYFNICILWCMSFILMITLYFEVLLKALGLLAKFIKIMRSGGK